MKKIRINKLTYFLIGTVIVAGILSHSFVEDAIKYEVVATESNRDDGINTEISKIIASDTGYVIYLENETLYVCTPNGEKVYKEENIKKDVFTKNDLIKLRKSGIEVSGLTELIELLNYIKS